LIFLKEGMEITTASEIKGKPIGGWLWVLMVSIIASTLSIIIEVFTTTQQLLTDDWKLYFQHLDELLQARIHIYLYLILSMTIAVGLLIWALISFFKRQKIFPAIFLGVLGFLILTEVLRIFMLDYYAGLTEQDASNLETGLAKTGIIAIVAGLYLNKGKRPRQTFVN
jgi:hypothetical protein